MVHARFQANRPNGCVHQVTIAEIIVTNCFPSSLFRSLCHPHHLIGFKITAVGIAVFHRHLGVVIGVFGNDHLVIQAVEHDFVTLFLNLRQNNLLAVNDHFSFLQQNIKLRVILGILLFAGFQNIRYLDTLDSARLLLYKVVVF